MLLPNLAADPLPPETAEWRKAFGVLRPTSPSCRYVNTAATWANIHESCVDFIESFGVEAVRLGWTTSELFGVHPEEHGLLRGDWCGLMMICGHKAIGIEADRISFGNLTGYRNVPGAPVGIPIWEFAARREKK